MITNISWEQFKELNLTNRKRLGKKNCIKIKDVVPGFACGGAFVVYEDFRYMCMDEADIQSIVNYVIWGEIYVDTGDILMKQYFKN